MKHHITREPMVRLIILFMLAMVNTLTIAQPNSAIESEIRKLEQSVTTAILKSDTSAMKQYWAPEFMVNTPRNNVAPNRQAVLQIQAAGMINYSTFNKVIEQIQVQNDVAITMGYETIVSKTDIPGAKAGQSFKRRFTNVWMKKNGKWQQIARHASMICQ